MRLSVRHSTRYRFAEPVVHALQRLRLTPKETQGQSIIEWNITYENAHFELEYDDQHFNHTTLIAVEPGASVVTVNCEGLVDTEDKAGVIGKHSGHLPLWAFCGQTKLTRPGPVSKALLDGIDLEGADPLPQLHELSRKIAESVEYRTGETGVTTTGEEAAERGRGVCQDHAHIFIGLSRLAGIPARYVSGYLMMNDRVEQHATHAWAEAHIEGLGWVGFDISNGISPDPRYVRVATGLDYRDAAPITGISFGSSADELEVDVAVEQQQIDQ